MTIFIGLMTAVFLIGMTTGYVLNDRYSPKALRIRALERRVAQLCDHANAIALDHALERRTSTYMQRLTEPQEWQPFPTEPCIRESKP